MKFITVVVDGKTSNIDMNEKINGLKFSDIKRFEVTVDSEKGTVALDIEEHGEIYDKNNNFIRKKTDEEE